MFIFFDEDSRNFTFCCDEMDILSVNLNNIDLDNNFDEDNSDAIILIRLLAYYIAFKNCQRLKKSENVKINVNSVAS